jgi:hypothetical protein
LPLDLTKNDAPDAVLRLDSSVELAAGGAKMAEFLRERWKTATAVSIANTSRKAQPFSYPLPAGPNMMTARSSRNRLRDNTAGQTAPAVTR